MTVLWGRATARQIARQGGVQPMYTALPGPDVCFS